MGEKAYCEADISAAWGGEGSGYIMLSSECGWPAVGMLNGMPVCERHEGEWREHHGLEKK